MKLKLPAEPTTDFPVYAQTGSLLSPSPKQDPREFRTRTSSKSSRTPTKVKRPRPSSRCHSPSMASSASPATKIGTPSTRRRDRSSPSACMPARFARRSTPYSTSGVTTRSTSVATTTLKTAPTANTTSLRRRRHLHHPHQWTTYATVGPDYVYRVEADGRDTVAGAQHPAVRTQRLPEPPDDLRRPR